MTNGWIVAFDILIIANLFAMGLLLCTDLTKLGRVVVAVLMFFSCAALVILTIGDLSLWLGIPTDRWFMNRIWRGIWRAPLGATLTAVNIAIVLIHRGSKG